VTENETAARLEYNQKIIEEFRANGGKVDSLGGMPVLLLTTVGSRTGRRRTSPVAYVTDGDRVMVVASNGGRDAHPSWYLNLLAEPKVTVERGTETYEAVAVPALGEEHDRLFAYVSGVNPAYAEYQAAVSRTMPVVVLEPVTG
jgi:deazaflavin-dependent oxidoreductase (nitroreductase family)